MYLKLSILLVFLIPWIGSMPVLSGYPYPSAKVLQIDVRHLLNGRSVTTFQKGKITTWDTGIDKDSGYLTMAAAAFMGDRDPHALPDDPLIPATAAHPEILLHYTNKSSLRFQTRCVPDSGEFVINIPPDNYSELYLSMTSSYGSTSLQFELSYTDGIESKNFILPDWFKDIPDHDPDLCTVVHNMGKWGNKNNLKEKDHHNIHALNIHPNADRVLRNIKLKKLPGGYLVFWAATGIRK